MLSPAETDRTVYDHVLRAFWATVPSAAGVLLVGDHGEPVAYDLVHTEDADALAQRAWNARAQGGAGVLVASEAGPVLAVFFPGVMMQVFPRMDAPEGMAG